MSQPQQPPPDVQGLIYGHEFNASFYELEAAKYRRLAAEQRASAASLRGQLDWKYS